MRQAVVVGSDGIERAYDLDIPGYQVAPRWDGGGMIAGRAAQAAPSASSSSRIPATTNVSAIADGTANGKCTCCSAHGSIRPVALGSGCAMPRGHGGQAGVLTSPVGHSTTTPSPLAGGTREPTSAPLHRGDRSRYPHRTGHRVSMTGKNAEMQAVLAELQAMKAILAELEAIRLLNERILSELQRIGAGR